MLMHTFTKEQTNCSTRLINYYANQLYVKINKGDNFRRRN